MTLGLTKPYGMLIRVLLIGLKFATEIPQDMIREVTQYNMYDLCILFDVQECFARVSVSHTYTVCRGQKSAPILLEPE